MGLAFASQMLQPTASGVDTAAISHLHSFWWDCGRLHEYNVAIRSTCKQYSCWQLSSFQCCPACSETSQMVTCKPVWPLKVEATSNSMSELMGQGIMAGPPAVTLAY